MTDILKDVRDRLESLLAAPLDHQLHQRSLSALQGLYAKVNRNAPARAFMRRLFEEQDGTMTLNIGPFGDGIDEEINLGPNPGFSDGCLVVQFRNPSADYEAARQGAIRASGDTQHGFRPGDAQAVRNLIEAMQGWLDWVEAKHD